MYPPIFRLGLRFKIIAFTSFVVILTSIVLGWFLVRRQVEQIAEHLKEKGTVLAQNAASASEHGRPVLDRVLASSGSGPILEARRDVWADDCATSD